MREEVARKKAPEEDILEEMKLQVVKDLRQKQSPVEVEQRHGL